MIGFICANESIFDLVFIFYEYLQRWRETKPEPNQTFRFSNLPKSVHCVTLTGCNVILTLPCISGIFLLLILTNQSNDALG